VPVQTLQELAARVVAKMLRKAVEDSAQREQVVRAAKEYLESLSTNEVHKILRIVEREGTFR